MSDAKLASAPTSLRRSIHQRDLSAAGARFRRVGEEMVVADFGRSDEAGRARHLGLADLSPLPRIGFKGPRMWTG